MSTKKVLITGVTGQDGSNMVRFLLANTTYEIYGTIRRLSVINHENISDINSDRFTLINLDITDLISINKTVKEINPDYIINLAAQSSVSESWNTPIHTFTTNTLSVIYFLEAIREYNPSCRFYSAGSSEEFGDIEYSPQDINHPLKPRTPYGASKCAARHIVKVYRECYNIYAIHGILFNHEGIHRGKNFITRKITYGIASIKKDLNDGKDIIPLELGNIYTSRDWSDSEDFIEAIWLMLNQESPKEYLLSSNELHTIKEFIDLTFQYMDMDMDIEWVIDIKNPINTKVLYKGQVIIKISQKYYRPIDVDLLYGDSTSTMKELNWKPSVSFNQLVKKMVDYDLAHC